MDTVTYCADRWECGAAALEVDAVVKARVTPDGVTFLDAYAPAGNTPLAWWQRQALHEWALDNQAKLRAANDIPFDHDQKDGWDLDPRRGDDQ